MIWNEEAFGGDLFKHLHLPKQCSKHRAYTKMSRLGKILNRDCIERCLTEINDRRFIGPWEGDKVVQRHMQSGLFTLVERRSGYLLAVRLPKLTAESTQHGVARLLVSRYSAEQIVTRGSATKFAGD